jgi:hypothetical protein
MLSERLLDVLRTYWKIARPRVHYGSDEVI